MAAARADMVAVLGLPQHFRPEEVLHYRQDLGRELAYPESTASYAALYYPWLVSREPEGRTALHGSTDARARRTGPALVAGHPSQDGLTALGLRRAGPEGAVCGIIAARGLARGAWVAAANEQVRNAVALQNPLTLAEQADLYNSGVNLIVREPRGFFLMGADTLSTDEDLLSLGVRRLLILLRDCAARGAELRLCATQARLSPTGGAGVRAVAGRYVLLAALLRGIPRRSLTGWWWTRRSIPRPASSRGQFIVELRVAPSSL